MTRISSPHYAKATSDFDSIPIVDLSDVKTQNGFSRIAHELIETAKKSGFFYVSNHGIDQVVIDRAFAASRSFFDLPKADKSTITVNQKQRGWMAQGMTNLEGAKTHDAKEVFFWGWDVTDDDPDMLAGLPMVAPNCWPDTVAPTLKRDLLPYYEQVVSLSRTILSALAVGLGQDRDFFAKAYEKPLARGQLVYYPTATDQDLQEERFGAATHSDFGVLTVLLQDMQGGLQVQNLTGDWIEAPPIAGTFVCNIGDLLERWTNNRLVSTKHRVLNRSGNSRYSIPIFCDPASDTVIDPRDLGVSDDKALFDPITAGDYIMSKNKRNFSQYKP